MACLRILILLGAFAFWSLSGAGDEPKVIELNEAKVLRAAESLSVPANMPMTIRKLSGGLTNDNYKLDIGQKTYFARCGCAHNSSLGSSLASEFCCLCLLSNVAIAPRPLVFDSKGGVLITEYIQVEQEGLNLHAPDNMRKVCDVMRTLHQLDIEFPRQFCPFETIVEYALFAQAVGAELPACIFDTVLPGIEVLKKNHGATVPVVPCHLDLHANNILSDGSRLWIIDWEYAAMADPLFDMASMASVEEFCDEEMLSLLDIYLEAPSSAAQKKHFYLMRIAADARWAIWCYTQAKISPIEGSYAEYGNAYLKSCLQRLRHIGVE